MRSSRSGSNLNRLAWEASSWFTRQMTRPKTSITRSWFWSLTKSGTSSPQGSRNTGKKFRKCNKRDNRVSLGFLKSPAATNRSRCLLIRTWSVSQHQNRSRQCSRFSSLRLHSLNVTTSSWERTRSQLAKVAVLLRSQSHSQRVARESRCQYSRSQVKSARRP